MTTTNTKLTEQDMLGRQYGYLIVVGPMEVRGTNKYWNCECTCGRHKFVAYSSLQSKRTTSCGCKRGLAPNRYKIQNYRGVITLKNLKTRCYNKNSSDYVYYGARGIELCKDWLEDSYKFYKWFDENLEEGKSLDRINNDKNYSPDNCKFSTASEQCYNRRPWIKTWL